MKSVAERGGGCSRYRYDRRGDLIEILEPNGSLSRYEYDSRRRIAAVWHADGAQTCYSYDEADRLIEVNDRGLARRYHYDAAGRLARLHHGKTGTAVFRYDEQGRIALARTSNVSTKWRYDAAGRICEIGQSFDGTSLKVHLDYDAQGRLSAIQLPGLQSRVEYEWDDGGKLAAVRLADKLLARLRYRLDQRTVCTQLGNGLEVERAADAVDGRPMRHTVRQGDQCLLRRQHAYENACLTSDGVRNYRYDPLDRLLAARDAKTGTAWRFAYDEMDNLLLSERDGHRMHYAYDRAGRLTAVQSDAGKEQELSYDERGRLKRRSGAQGTWTYRYDDADRLIEVRRSGSCSARFVYDHKGLLVWADFGGRVERYVYGPSDELVSVTDALGKLKRAFIHTPMGLLAEVSVDGDGTCSVFYAHMDSRATLCAFSDSAGRLAETFSYSPFGVPLEGDHKRGMFGGQSWVPEVGLYYCRARWYDPRLGRFITPDSYSGAPDDERLTFPARPASQQLAARAQLLGDWLKQPRVRNRYAYCGNDPVGRVDPNGHWSAGWVILSILGAIWTLPNTLIGLVIEISCLILEALRWVLFGISFGNVRWEALKSPGFDAAASGRLNAFALVFKGGWIGSFGGLLGITFGNVFFVNPDWEQHPELGGPGDVFPTAYNGQVALPRREALYEHELRHVNHQSWLGPFFYLALPIWGFFFWDLMFNGYCNMWLERDARSRAGL